MSLVAGCQGSLIIVANPVSFFFLGAFNNVFGVDSDEISTFATYERFEVGNHFTNSRLLPALAQPSSEQVHMGFTVVPEKYTVALCTAQIRRKHAIRGSVHEL